MTRHRRGGQISGRALSADYYAARTNDDAYFRTASPGMAGNSGPKAGEALPGQPSRPDPCPPRCRQHAGPLQPRRGGPHRFSRPQTALPADPRVGSPRWPEEVRTVLWWSAGTECADEMAEGLAGSGSPVGQCGLSLKPPRLEAEPPGRC